MERETSINSLSSYNARECLLLEDMDISSKISNYTFSTNPSLFSKNEGLLEKNPLSRFSAKRGSTNLARTELSVGEEIRPNSQIPKSIFNTPSSSIVGKRIQSSRATFINPSSYMKHIVSQESLGRLLSCLSANSSVSMLETLREPLKRVKNEAFRPHLWKECLRFVYSADSTNLQLLQEKCRVYSLK